MFKTREDIKHLGKIKQYAKVSDSGDKGGLADVPENAPIWMQVTSTRDNCLGQECPNHKECFVLKARTEAMKADIVVVNHHLFFADVMLRDEGVAELLPACNTVIFDEAHQLPETASLFFGETLSTALLLDLARDTRIEAAAGAKDFAPLAPRLRRTGQGRARLAAGVQEGGQDACHGDGEFQGVRARAEDPGRKAGTAVRPAGKTGGAQRRAGELLATRTGAGAAAQALAIR